MWDVEYTDELGAWWDLLDADEQESVAVNVELLRQLGPQLPRPHADTLYGSRHSNMKELRTQHAGRPLRTLFAFDPRRCAILLISLACRKVTSDSASFKTRLKRRELNAFYRRSAQRRDRMSRTA